MRIHCRPRTDADGSGPGAAGIDSGAEAIDALEYERRDAAAVATVTWGRALGSAVFAALAAWLSTGTLALATEDGPRIALLPLSPFAVALSSAAGLAVLGLRRAGAPAAPLALLAFIFLPWLPAPVPTAALSWSGPLAVLLWFATFSLLVGAVWRGGAMGTTLAAVESFVASRPRLAAALGALAISAAAAAIAAPSVPGGDEPHYLVITQSLLLDGDLKIENNHARRDYQAYYAGQLRPDFQRRGRDGEIYSIHAPGIPALVAPAFAIGGYRGVVIFLIALAACGGALLWHVAWLASRNQASAWFAWAAIVFGSTWIFHTFTIYPDGVAGAVALTGLWALVRGGEEQRSGSTRAWPWLWHGLALAMLPWLHSRFALLAGSLGSLILLRLSTTRNPAGKAVAFLVAPATSALLWIGYFIALYGTPDPSAPYEGTREFSAAFIPGGLAGLLFDQRFGLIANTPVLACAVFGFASMLRTGRSASSSAAPNNDSTANRRLALELLFVVVPYLLTVTNYAMWWGGWSAPARFGAAVVPVLVVPVAAAWTGFRTEAARLAALGALGMTAFLSAVLVAADRGRLAFNTREAYALWLDWASRLTDLGRGVPAWFRDAEGPFFRDIAVWLVAMAMAGIMFRVIALLKVVRQPGLIPTIGIALLAFAAMIALTITWTLHGLLGTSGAIGQLQFLRRLSTEPRAIVLSVYPLARLDPDNVVRTIQIQSGGRPTLPGGAERNDRPLLTLPALPGGTYRIRPRTTGSGGLVMIGVGQDQFSVLTETLTMPPSPLVVDFPVDVRALILRGDEDARRVVREVVVEPLTLVRPASRLTRDTARRAVRYPTSRVFFLDDRSFPEPDAFWVGGARSSSIVVQPDRSASAITLELRNAPVENRIVLESAAWREDLTLAPGEERRIHVPYDAARGAGLIKIETSAGFRPSEREPGSRDERFLGVWVRVD